VSSAPHFLHIGWAFNSMHSSCRTKVAAAFCIFLIFIVLIISGGHGHLESPGAQQTIESLSVENPSAVSFEDLYWLLYFRTEEFISEAVKVPPGMNSFTGPFSTALAVAFFRSALNQLFGQ
jgi:hypothetical protein